MTALALPELCEGVSHAAVHRAQMHPTRTAHLLNLCSSSCSHTLPFRPSCRAVLIRLCAGMSYHHDGTVLASCSFDGLLRLWDTSTGHCLVTRALENAEHPLSCIEFSPNGEQQDMWCHVITCLGMGIDLCPIIPHVLHVWLYTIVQGGQGHAAKQHNVRVRLVLFVHSKAASMTWIKLLPHGMMPHSRRMSSDTITPGLRTVFFCRPQGSTCWLVPWPARSGW